MFKAFFDLSSDIHLITDPKGNIIEANRAFENLMGYSSNELKSKNFKDFIFLDDIERTLIALSKLKKTHSIESFHTRLQDISGNKYTITWNATYDTEKHVIYIIARDVTESSEIKRNLDQIYQSLYDHTIIAVTDPAGVILEVNDKFCEISEYSPEELIGKTHKVINSGVHSKEFRKDMWDTISQGKTWSGIIENRKKSNKPYFVYSILTPLFDPKGEITEYLTIRFDMTESINLEKDHAKILKILNETNSIAQVGGWEMDVATQELTWTDETFKILEVEKSRDRKPILPEGLALFTEDNIPIIEKAVHNCATEGIPYSLELEAKTAKGNIVWVYTNGKANYIDGKIVSISGTIQDIHDKKLNEIKLIAEQQKNIQFSKLASLGEMSAGVAHEINNPLAIIMGTIEMLTKYRQDETKFNKKVESIGKSVDRIAKIVKNLKKFSRSSDSQQREKLSLKAIINECIELVQLKSNRYSINIEFKAESDYKVIANEIEMEQVLINLIANSVDAIKGFDEKWIKIELFLQDQLVCINITDSGSGISKEVMDRLFEPFYTTKAVGEGTGLGLSISAGIIEDHGGQLEYNKVSPNTSFLISLPLAD